MKETRDAWGWANWDRIVVLEVQRWNLAPESQHLIACVQRQTVVTDNKVVTSSIVVQSHNNLTQWTTRNGQWFTTQVWISTGDIMATLDSSVCASVRQGKARQMEQEWTCASEKWEPKVWLPEDWVNYLQLSFNRAKSVYYARLVILVGSH